MSDEAENQNQGGEGSGESEGGSGSSEGGEDFVSQATPEQQTKAKEMGWIPPESWRGSRENYVDADKFLERGETLVPFLRADRRRLEAGMSDLRQQNQQLQDELRQTRESVQELATFSRDMAKERNARRKEELNGLIKEASDAGNESGAAELRAELNEIVTRERSATTRSGESTDDNNRQPPPNRERPAMAPWVRSWLDDPENQAFLRVPHQADVFNGVVSRLRQSGDKRVGETDGPAFLNDAMRQAREVFGSRPNPRRQEAGRTEEGRPSGGAPRGNGKGYGDMPKEARDKCDAQEKRFVGKGKSFANTAEFRKFYAAEYFGPSAAAAERLSSRGE